MATHGKAEEAIIQSNCVIWLWNNYPETRGLFFAIENEGSRLSSKLIKDSMLYIQANITKPALVSNKCREIINMCIKGNPVAGAQARSMGVTRGVSDCLFMWNKTVYCFEFKTQIGRQSEHQVEWQKKVENNNYEYFLIRSVDDFQKIIKKIISKI